MADSDSMQKGIQPLDGLMNRLGLANSDLVKASPEQITHKMVSKARKGRRISPRIQIKILNALNRCQEQAKFSLPDLFTYK